MTTRTRIVILGMALAGNGLLVAGLLAHPAAAQDPVAPCTCVCPPPPPCASTEAQKAVDAARAAIQAAQNGPATVKE